MTTVITGATRGIGLATALALASDRTHTIVLAGRDIMGLVKAAHRIESVTGNQNLVPMLVDLAALASVRAFVTELRERALPSLRAIICNAGVSAPTTTRRSADDYELTFAVNHLSHFVLVNLLLADLEPPARILFVSSGVHDPARRGSPTHTPRFVKAEWLAYPERDPQMLEDDRAAGGRACASSKLCNVLCAYELARRLDASGLSTAEHPITSNAFAPGLVAGTGLGRDEKGMTRFTWYYVMPLMSRLMGFGRTPAAAGAELAYVATAPEVSEVTGAYFSGRHKSRSSTDSHDRAKAEDLWQTSVRLSGLKPHESPLIQA